MQLRKGMYNINGVERIVVADIEKESLADVLRRIGLVGTKVGCGNGQCGACTVLVDGEPVRACIKKFKTIPEHTCIETIEGLGTADNLHPLQLAWIKYGGVQCGFCTPGFIMSSKALLEKNPDPTRDEVRAWFSKHNNLCRCTGYKPLIDAVMAAAAVMRGDADVSTLYYEEEEDGHIYNTRYPRPAATAKVMGACYYGDDMGQHMPTGTLEMAVKFSDKMHANILSIDTSEAEAMPGVVKILTAKDVQGTNLIGSPLAHLRAQAKEYDWPILCDKKVVRRGDSIAIAVADTREHARAAAAKVKVEYEDLPIYENYLEACKADSVRIDQHSDNVWLYQPVFKGEDTREIFKQAEDPDSDIVMVEGSFYSSREPHLPLEPNSLQCYWDEDGLLTIQYKGQTIWTIAAGISAGIGLEKEKIRIIESPTGASFGSAMTWDVCAIIAVAEMAVNQPINWTLTSAEHQVQTGKRAASYANVRLAARKSDAKIQAIEWDMGADLGAYVNYGIPLMNKIIRFWGYSYNVPNIRGLCRLGRSNQPPCVAYRAFGSPQTYTGSEAIIDMMAEKLGMDPYEFRMANISKPGDLNSNGAPHRLYQFEAVGKALKPYYDKALEWKKEAAPEGWKRGVGVCFGGYHVSGANDKSFVDIELMPDGTVTCYNCWEDQGQGADIGTLVHVHEDLKELGLKPEQIKLYQNDTKYCPATGAASGSRSHFIAGLATKDACDQLLNAMRKDDGTFRTYDEMVAEGIPTKYNGSVSLAYMGLEGTNPDTGLGNYTPDQNFISYVAQVEVEEATGLAKCRGLHMITDVGVVGNYLALEGQVYGGSEHCIGFALTEDYNDNAKKYTSLLGCGFPKADDIPDGDDFTVDFIQTPREWGPHGSGGASESFQCCGHVAVLNAINDAVGVRIHEIPATKDKVKKAMDLKAQGKPYEPEKYDLGEDFNEVLDYIKAHPLKDKVKISEEDKKKAALAHG